jgi:pimeloyl-ACP methyl ester carboxylesterase
MGQMKIHKSIRVERVLEIWSQLFCEELERCWPGEFAGERSRLAIEYQVYASVPEVKLHFVGTATSSVRFTTRPPHCIDYGNHGWALTLKSKAAVLFAMLALMVFLVTPGAAYTVRARYRWEIVPPTPSLPTAERSGFAPVNGIRLWYATFGHGEPVILVDGGLTNANYWGLQVRALAPHFEVIVLDSRGHGRSTQTAAPFSYDQMSSDVLALMDYLHIHRAALVGFSDGGIIGLDIAIHYPDRLTRLFAFGANSDPSGVKDVSKNPTFTAFVARAGSEYQQMSPTPTQYKTFLASIEKMWEMQPHFTDGQLSHIKVPTWIVDGDHDEIITRENTDHMAALIPGAGELILPQVSHFAFLQDPVMFNQALLTFLLTGG